MNEMHLFFTWNNYIHEPNAIYTILNKMKNLYFSK